MYLILSFIGGGELVIILLFSLFVFLIPVIALIDILKSNFKGNDKIMWVLVVLLLPLLGALLYFLIGKNQKI